MLTDFTSVNSFQDDLKFTSPSFYNLTPPPPPTSRPPGYDVQNYQTTTNAPPNGTIPAENYYAATDIIKVRDVNNIICISRHILHDTNVKFMRLLVFLFCFCSCRMLFLNYCYCCCGRVSLVIILKFY